MSSRTTPGSGASLVRDAHYHPIRATQTWRTYIAAMAQLATDTAADRAEVARKRHDETTYARGTLGAS